MTAPDLCHKLRDLAVLAKEDGVSVNQWIAVAVAEKVGVVETAAEFFKK
jgi:predicted HicB family RNase H-like nuclease